MTPAGWSLPSWASPVSPRRRPRRPATPRAWATAARTTARATAVCPAMATPTARVTAKAQSKSRTEPLSRHARTYTRRHGARRRPGRASRTAVPGRRVGGLSRARAGPAGGADPGRLSLPAAPRGGGRPLAAADHPLRRLPPRRPLFPDPQAAALQRAPAAPPVLPGSRRPHQPRGRPGRRRSDRRGPAARVGGGGRLPGAGRLPPDRRHQRRLHRGGTCPPGPDLHARGRPIWDPDPRGRQAGRGPASAGGHAQLLPGHGVLVGADLRPPGPYPPKGITRWTLHPRIEDVKSRNAYPGSLEAALDALGRVLAARGLA